MSTSTAAAAPPAPGTCREATPYEVALHRAGVADGITDMLNTIESWLACARAGETDLDELAVVIEDNRKAVAAMRKRPPKDGAA